MIILVDMDGVLADYEGKLIDMFKEQYPDKPYVPFEDLTTFYAEKCFPKKSAKLLKSIQFQPNFIPNLPVIKGGLEAITEMEEKGHDVRICTSPLSKYKYCVLEKYEWIEEHFGFEWTRKMILTKDKTLIQGDILIDDKPNITGLLKPTWEHILYTQPWNKHLKDRKRLTWDNWKEVIQL